MKNKWVPNFKVLPTTSHARKRSERKLLDGSIEEVLSTTDQMGNVSCLNYKTNPFFRSNC